MAKSVTVYASIRVQLWVSTLAGQPLASKETTNDATSTAQCDMFTNAKDKHPVKANAVADSGFERIQNFFSGSWPLAPEGYKARASPSLLHESNPYAHTGCELQTRSSLANQGAS